MKILRMISLISILALGGCSYAQKIKGYAFAKEQMQGTVMVDEEGRQLPPVKLVQRFLYVFVPVKMEGDLVADSVFYQDKLVDFSKGELTYAVPDLYLKGGANWQPDIKGKGRWYSMYVSFAEQPEKDGEIFRMPVRIVGRLNGQSFVVNIKEELWVESIPAQ